MTANTKIGITVGSALLIATVVILYNRNKVKKRGWTKNKLASNLFKVPLVDKKYMDLEEQVENIATKDGIEFR